MKSLLMFVAVLLLPVSATARDPDFKYMGWFDRDTIHFHLQYRGEPHGRIGYSDALDIAKKCDDTSLYHCFFTLRLAFAVPKDLDPNAQKWTVREQTFELVEKDLSISLLGTRLDNLLLIKSPAAATLRGRTSGKAAYYLYSQRFGLIGLGDDPSLEASTTYWLTGSLGFGAPREAVAHSP